jgi:hypothetical protein
MPCQSHRGKHVGQPFKALRKVWSQEEKEGMLDHLKHHATTHTHMAVTSDMLQTLPMQNVHKAAAIEAKIRAAADPHSLIGWQIEVLEVSTKTHREEVALGVVVDTRKNLLGKTEVRGTSCSAFLYLMLYSTFLILHCFTSLTKDYSTSRQARSERHKLLCILFAACAALRCVALYYDALSCAALRFYLVFCTTFLFHTLLFLSFAHSALHSSILCSTFLSQTSL